MGGVRKIVKKGLGEMMGGGAINWFPGHMAAATRAIRQRLKLADLVIEVRDARIPLSSANEDLQPLLSGKRRVIALNKKDLANPNIMHKWTHYFDSCKQDCLSINAHSKSSVNKLLELVEFKLKERISREPTLLVMVSAIVRQLVSSNDNFRFILVQQKAKRATVGPLPGVTQDIAGFKIFKAFGGYWEQICGYQIANIPKMMKAALVLWIIANQPSIYVLDTPGVLVPSIPDIETGLKLALAGSVKDSVVGEERIAQYLLAVLNTRNTPLHWRHLRERKVERIPNDSNDKHEYNLKDLLPQRRKPPNASDVHYIEDLVTEVQRALYATLFEFSGNLEDESELESLIEQQFEVLQKALKIPHKASEARTMVSKKFLTLFRTGKLGPFILDDVPDTSNSTS
ncbi:hypothetical protein LguiB_004347 [Lonicera macranthoides]